MESTEMTQQTFAEQIGISPASMSSIFNGRTNPTLNIVEAIKRRFPTISTDWLVFGVGDMYADASTATPSAEAAVAEVDEPGLPFDQEPANEIHRQGALVMPKTSTTNAKPIAMREIAAPAKSLRTITEIRVFYDDQTYESFTPKK